MKINGETPAPNRVIIPIPRSDQDNIIFIATPVLDIDEFDKLLKRPEPPTIRRPDNTTGEDLKDPKYLAAISKYVDARGHWTVIKSLETSPGLEWETVDTNNPSTFANYKTELENAHFTENEIASILSGVYQANGLSESLVQQARKSFLAQEANAKESNSNQEELSST